MNPARFRQRVPVLIFALVVGLFVVDIITPREYTHWTGYVIPLLLTLYVGGRLFTLWLAVILSALMVVGFYFSSEEVKPLAALNRFIGIGVFWVVAWLVVQDKRLKEEVQRVKRALMAIRDCNQALVRANDEPALLEKVCRIIVEDGGYRFCWIGFSQDDAVKTIRPVVHAGHEAGFLEKATLTWADTERGRGPTGTALRTGQAALCKNVRTDPQFAPWRDDAIQRGYGACVALPLLSEGKAFGALSIYSAVPGAFSAEELKLLTELADDLAFGIQSLRSDSSRQRVEAALAEERNLLKTLLDNIPDKIYFKDHESRFLRTNPAHARQFGLDNPAEAIGKTDADFFSEEHAQQAYEDEQAIIRTGEPLVGREEKETWPDGRVAWASTTKMLLRDMTGKIIGTFGISRDITERKRAEEIVRESEEQFRTLVENSPDAIFVQTGRQFVYLNAAALRLLGVTSVEQIIGQQVAERIHPDFRDAVKQRQILTEQQKSAPAFEEVYLKLNGMPVPVEVNAAPIMYRGQPGAVVFVRDISERKRVEKELAESQGRLKAVFDYASDGILAADVEQMSFLLCNPRICQMLGYSQEEMRSLKVRDLHPEAALPYVLDQFQKQANKETALSRDIPVKRKDGSVFYADVNSFPLTLGGRKCLVGFFRDITERKQVEEKIRQLVTEQETILDTVAAGICFLKKRRLQWINPAFAKMFGYEPREITGLDTLIFYTDAEDYQRLGRDGYAQLAVGGIYRTELLMKKKDGTRFWCSLTGRAINPRNLDEGSIWVLSDITKHRQAEAALRDSEDKLTRAQALAHVGHWSRDLITNTVQWSEETFRIFGRTPQAGPADAKVFFEAIHPDDREQISREIAEALAGTKIHDIEFRLVRPDGTIRFVHAIGEVYRDQSGKPLRMFGSVADITERKWAEEMMRDSDQRMRLATEATEVGIWEWNVITDSIRWDAQMFRIYGLEPIPDGFIQYGDWRDAVLPEDLPGQEAILRDTIKRLGHSAREFRIRRRSDGQVRFIQAVETVRTNALGKAEWVVGTNLDITERKQAEERIQEQAALLDKAQDAIFVLDMGRRIIFWNKGAERVFGWTAAEAIGRLATDLMFHGIVTPQLQEARKVTEQQRGEWIGELEEYTKDGRKIIVQTRSTLIRDEQGRPKAILVIDTDITEKKQLEAHFLRAQRMESLGVLAGGIAHDLNNILAPLLMSVRLLQDEVKSAEAVRTLEVLERSVVRGKELVKQVLAFGRGLKGERLPLPLGRLGREIEQIVREAFPKSIEFDYHAADGSWTVLGDATQLHQVLLNLCVNARDAMPHGGKLSLRIENRVLDESQTRLHPESKPGPYVVINVRDTGAGMTRETQEKMFDPFFTTKTPDRGTGLGLFTSLGIVMGHGGFIDCCSEPGKGTTFEVYLPASVAHTTGKIAGRAESNLPRGQNELVLVVDDEEPIRQVAEKILERFGYRSLLAADGAQAVALYKSRQTEISAVITDMTMPVMDGLATVRALKVVNPDVKIIGSSGLGGYSDVNAATETGVQRFVSKPYTAEILLHTLHEILHQKPGQT